MIEVNPSRSKKLEMLKGITREYLVEKLPAQQEPSGRLQFLVNIALWLSRDEATRLADTVFCTWSTLEHRKHSVMKLGYLVEHCHSANPNASQALVKQITAASLESLIKLDGPEDAMHLGALLARCEESRAGTVKEWCDKSVEFLRDTALTLSDDAIDGLLFSLVTYAPGIVIAMAKNPQVLERFRNGKPSYGLWPRRQRLQH